ncbi:alkaline phosphatase, partial [Sesbania bispinosa]
QVPDTPLGATACLALTQGVSPSVVAPEEINLQRGGSSGVTPVLSSSLAILMSADDARVVTEFSFHHHDGFSSFLRRIILQRF